MAARSSGRRNRSGPASVYAEIAIAAGRILFGSAAVVEQVDLTEAVSLADRKSVEIQAVAAPEETEFFHPPFSAVSRKRATGGRRETAGFAMDQAKYFLLPMSPLGKYAELSEEVITGGRHTKRMAEMEYDFGPAFCCVDWMFKQDYAALAQIETEQPNGELRDLGDARWRPSSVGASFDRAAWNTKPDSACKFRSPGDTHGRIRPRPACRCW